MNSVKALKDNDTEESALKWHLSRFGRPRQCAQHKQRSRYILEMWTNNNRLVAAFQAQYSSTALSAAISARTFGYLNTRVPDGY